MPAIFLSGKSTFKVKPVSEDQKRALEEGLKTDFYGLRINFHAGGTPSVSSFWKSFLKKGDFHVTKDGEDYLVVFDGVFRNSFSQITFDSVLESVPEVRIEALECAATIPVDGEPGKVIVANLKFTKTAPKRW